MKKRHRRMRLYCAGSGTWKWRLQFSWIPLEGSLYQPTVWWPHCHRKACWSGRAAHNFFLEAP